MKQTDEIGKDEIEKEESGKDEIGKEESGKREKIAEKEADTKRKVDAANRKKLGLTGRIFLGLLLGAAVGVCLNRFAQDSSFVKEVLTGGVFYVVGSGFLRLMQMLVVPLVFSSLVCGSMSMGDSKKLGRIGLKTLLFYFATTAVAITMALFVGRLIRPGAGLNLTADASAAAAVERTGFAETLLNMIPINPAASLAEGNMLQIILFALFTGIILAGLKQKAELVGRFFGQLNEIMLKMTVAVMHVAPYGVFCLIARTFSEIGVGGVKHLFQYMIGVLLGLLVQGFVIYMIMLKCFTGLSPFQFLKKFSPVIGFAFSTASSNAAIPMSIETLWEKAGVSEKISSFTIPLGATINMDGTAILQGVAVIFAAEAYHIALTPADYLTVILTATLASVGTAGVPGVGLITLTMVFASVGLPVEAITMIMGIDRILDMSRTAVNVTGDAVCTTIVAAGEGLLDRKVFSDG